MKKYILKRILLMIITFLGITVITYIMIRKAPGDYSTMQMGMQGALKSGSVGQTFIDQERKIFGLDKDPVTGYLEWLSNAAVLDFGISRKNMIPVWDRIAEALPVTLKLNIITILVIYLFSIPMGVITAVKKNSAIDRITSFILFILYSLPSFWVGLMLLMYLSSGEYLNLFPLGGISSEWANDLSYFQRFLNTAWHYVLPVTTLTLGSFAFYTRYIRANMLEVINQQYIITARAKGLSENKVIFVHAFKNSLIPLITIMASLLPALLGGSVIVESIFSIPGLGRLAFEAILTRDLPVIMAIASLTALLTMIGILIADIMYVIVDPRIRLESKL